MLARTGSFVLGLSLSLAPVTTGARPMEPDFVDLTGSRLAVVRIPAGTFRMGSDQLIRADDYWKPCPACLPRNDVERPVHQVTISKDYWIGQFPVTQRQWQEVMGNNPSHARALGPDAPVEQVSWKQVQVFLGKVNSIQSRWTVRLPTEAEWEYAARAGTTGETYGPLDEIAWYEANAGHSTHPVGQKLANAFGVYDMLAGPANGRQTPHSRRMLLLCCGPSARCPPEPRCRGPLFTQHRLPDCSLASTRPLKLKRTALRDMVQ